ncbi:fatty acyl-CoA reductase 1-like [Phlebotomus argentipes]|uniref:fatty acyl-CoA reductase 1-like n=1 Tax=Phlebotomus argentipes TaxID=94469 RepID=UPI00289380C3|nr:fatty acyl-CoA reductase 1-like [Phlebotomus argentipes]XP_059612969.1 fatty acyl-CoA reductase 1-like [Phlebotomus argentipes]
MQRLIDERKFDGKEEKLEIQEPDMALSTPMRDFFRGKKVLITGGTGFIGRLLVEKLLRVGVSMVYLVVRPKKAQVAKQRMDELSQGAIFDRLRLLDPNFTDRIHPIEGDLCLPDLGLDRESIELLEDNVEIVIHAGADVRFDETLAAAVQVNIRGTRDILDMAVRMKKLEVFVYVSTAYSNCPRREVHEQFYSPPMDPYKMIELVARVERGEISADDLSTLSAKIINPWPNTYSYTKALSEGMVKDYGERLPIAVVRPSIVIATHSDPFPGWSENVYGLNGILVACSLGLLRALYLRSDYVGDVIPADFVSNTVLAVAWLTTKEKSVKADAEVEEKEPQRTKIYNCTSSADNPITWGLVNDSMYKIYECYPPKRGLWINCFTYTRYKLLYTLNVIFYHVLPAILLDVIFKFGGKKLRLLPVYRKIQKFTEALSYFTTNEWMFYNNNMRHLYKSLAQEDYEYFPCDVKKMIWMEYIHDYGKGMRRHIGKETMDTLPEGRKRMFRITILHNIIKGLFYMFWAAVIYVILRFYRIIDPIDFSMFTRSE